MAKREIHRLKAIEVGRLSKPGYHADGAGLYLQVSSSGSKSWVFRFMLAGRSREMGLGSLLRLSLADARKAAEQARARLGQGIDPIEAARAAEAAIALAQASTRTFRECSEQFLEAHRAGWKNAKHAAQWESTLSTYAYPVIGSIPVSAVNVGLVIQILTPIWTIKTETASRVRGRIESVLDWATVRGFRSGGNPARWRGNLDALLPEPNRVTKVKHHPALHYEKIAAFLPELRKVDGVSACALELAILTATRTNEVIGAKWEEFDLPSGEWKIPADRMKAGQEHRVPLSSRALAILRHRASTQDGAFVFPGSRVGKPLSNMALLEVIRGMGRVDITVHGFRSTFRDWAAEQTNFPNHVVEMALAHSIGDKTEAAYRRGELFSKRAKLMQAWADFCEKTPAKVVKLNGLNQINRN